MYAYTPDLVVGVQSRPLILSESTRVSPGMLFETRVIAFACLMNDVPFFFFFFFRHFRPIGIVATLFWDHYHAEQKEIY